MIVDLRCPENPSRLFAKISKPTIVDGNLIEIACRDCRKDTGARLVLHRFNVLGEHVETEIVR